MTMILLGVSSLSLDHLDLGATPLDLFPPLLLQCLLPLLSPPLLSSVLNKAMLISFSVLSVATDIDSDASCD